MNKTVSINISGIVFNIDEEAFHLLNRYLNTIKGYFSDSDGRDEIMADIEARIAEMLSDKLNDRKQVISKEDIDAVIAIMGQPEEYLDDEARGESSSGHRRTPRSSRSRRLYRDIEGKSIGGVCSGIGYYFGFDPTWLRIAFLITIFFGGLGFYLYIILWIILPPARTTAEKLEMKGEPVNYENIGKAVEDEMESVKKKFNDFTSSNSTRVASERLNNAISNFFDGLGQVLIGFIKIIGKIVASVFLLFAAFLLLVLVFSIFQWHTPIFHFPGIGLPNTSIQDFSEIIFTSNTQSTLAIIGVGLSILIPLIALLIYGARLLFNLKREIKGLGFVLLILWIASIFLCITVALQVGTDFQRTSDFDETQTLNIATNDTLMLDVGQDPFRVSSRARRYAPKDILMKFESNELILGHPQLQVLRSNNENFQIEVYKISQGASSEEAGERAETINYSYQVDSNQAIFNPFYKLNLEDPYRGQRVKVYVKVPIGGSIYFSKKMDRIIYDVDNVTNMHDRKMVDHYWTMTQKGLVCTDCPDQRKRTSLKIKSNDETSEIIITSDGED